MLGLALVLARTLTLLRLFQSAEAKVFWQLAEKAVVLSPPVAAAVSIPLVLPHRVPVASPVRLQAPIHRLQPAGESA